MNDKQLGACKCFVPIYRAILLHPVKYRVLQGMFVKHYNATNDVFIVYYVFVTLIWFILRKENNNNKN